MRRSSFATLTRVLLPLPLLFVLGCQQESSDNLRESYERMMAAAERRAAQAADTPAAPVAGETAEPPTTIPMEALPPTGDVAIAPEPEPEEPPPAQDTAPLVFEGTAGVEQRQRAVSPVTLRDVRSAEHGGFDRVVFEFSGGLPGYRVEHINAPIRECASGNTVQIAGQGWLRVRIEPARAHELVGETARVTVSNTNRQLDHGIVQQMRLTCDFEAQVEWVLGLSAPNRYRVLELSEPAHLVVDVLH
jgi:hypothetical protein